MEIEVSYVSLFVLLEAYKSISPCFLQTTEPVQSDQYTALLTQLKSILQF